MPTSADRPVTRRNQWALPVLAGMFVGVPIIEVLLLIKVGHAIGAFPTLLILVAEAIIGAWLMRKEGSKAWQALRDSLTTGRMPARELTDAALVLVGGLLLMLPGFFTDVIGFVFLLPFTRPLARSIVGFFAAKQVQKAGVSIDLARARTRPDMTVPTDIVEAEASEHRNPEAGSAQQIARG